jgi:long-chain fatty acid transport protein
MRRLPLLGALVMGALLAPNSARAGGFYIYEHSALATGMADARTALWDDPSSLFYNPSAITELDGFQLSLGDTLLFPDVTYTPTCATGDTCRSANTEFHVFYPAHVYFTAEIVPWLHAGLSYHNPFGLGTYWPADWDGRFTAWQTYIETHFVEAELALDIAELAGMSPDYALSFAVGGTYVYGKATINQKLDATEVYNMGHDADDPPPVADMEMEGDANGGGYQFSLFAAYKPWISFGASVRSNITMDFTGTAAFSAPDAAFPGWGTLMRLAGFLPESSGGSTTIELPWNMNFGVAFHGLPQFTFAADVYVAMWQSYDQLQVHFDCEQAGTCSPDLNVKAVYPKKWNTGVQLSFGVEYRPIRDVALRAGYGYVTNPANPVYYDGMLPDGNRNLITFGIGYRAAQLFKIDVGYMLAIWSGTKDNNVGADPVITSYFPNVRANGTYDTLTHIIALSLGFSFDAGGMAPPPTLDDEPAFELTSQ